MADVTREVLDVIRTTTTAALPLSSKTSVAPARNFS